MTLISRLYFKYHVACAAALILAIAMGIGRFAYTAIYPYSLAEGILTAQTGGMLAAANYSGYLVGALLALKIPAHWVQRTVIATVLLTVLGLALLALLQSWMLMLVIRTVAGLCSAMVMINLSRWLFEQYQYVEHAAILYAGVGIGIVLSSECIAWAASLGLSSQGLWAVVTLLALILLAIAVLSLSLDPPRRDMVKPVPVHSSLIPTQSQPRYLMLLYGLAGLGYIITATYLPSLVQQALPDVAAAHIWAIFGLAAIPSCWFWSWLSQQLGVRWGLLSNLAVQALGVSLPIFVVSEWSYVWSAILVGGCFMGTVTLAMITAQALVAKGTKHLIALMTMAYGIGQILGPVLMNLLLDWQASMQSALICATVALLLAICCVGRC